MTFWEYLEAMAHMEATGTAAPQDQNPLRTIPQGYGGYANGEGNPHLLGRGETLPLGDPHRQSLVMFHHQSSMADLIHMRPFSSKL